MNPDPFCTPPPGLWDEGDGFYYDHLRVDDVSCPLKVRSMVGLVPLFSCLVLEDARVKKLPGFEKRTRWFVKNRADLASRVGVKDLGTGH